ncbi:NADH_oxidase [Hexamita inflata]|uniref:NADH oxidase n=1 Tax=Hexamita inflata TaxID=28002 RepID=A0AA86PD34_9EUKA|nr:NADH oxidase [Hexamita inflata]
MMGCGNIAEYTQDITEQETKKFQIQNINEQNQQKYIQRQSPRQLNLKQLTVCIVGCTHAGTMAAIALRNMDPKIRIIAFEKTPTVSFLNCGIHLAVNKTCSDLSKMFYNSPVNMRKLGIEIYTNTYVEHINFQNKQLLALDQVGQTQQTFQYDKLIIATGSKPVIPPVIDGIDYNKDPVDEIRNNLNRILVVKTYKDAQRLIALKDVKKILILGAGHIGMEMVWSFQSIGAKVTVLDHGPHIMGKYFDPEYIQILEDECKNLEIELWMKARVVKMQETQYGVQVTVERIVGDTIKTIQAIFDYVLLAIGFKPNTEQLIAESSNQLWNMKNVILVNQKQQTSITDVYAIGDCSTSYHTLLNKQTYIPLASHAVRQGVTAAYQALGNELRTAGTNCSYGIQLFNYSLASTGFSYEQAEKMFTNVGRIVYSDYLWQKYCEKKVDKVIQKEELGSHFTILGDMVRDMADMIVESFDMDIEQTEDQLVSVILVINQNNNKIIGCQVMGKQDITQIVNAASIAIQTGMTIQELAFSDLGGFEGETKPWGILQMAAASVDIAVPDFEEEEF